MHKFFSAFFFILSFTLSAQDSAGVFTAIDSLGQITSIVNDEQGRVVLMQKQNAVGEILAKQENEYGSSTMLVKETTFPSNKEYRTLYQSDSEDRLLSIIHFLGTTKEQTTSLSYNESGEQIAAVKPDGAIIHYIYDSQGRLEECFSGDFFHYVYAYDSNNNMVSITDTILQETTSRSFNEHGRLIQEILGNGLSLCYTYDNYDRLTGLTLPDGSSVYYVYDEQNLREVHRGHYQHRYLTYDQMDNVVHAQLMGNIGEIAYSRDSSGRLVEVLTPYWSERKISYDSVGNLISHKIEDTSGEEQFLYEYDDLYQLKEEGKAKNEDASIYDLNGNLIQKEYQGKILTFTYDPLDRLITVTKGEEKIVYTYDGFDRRTSKSYFIDKDSENKSWYPIRKENYFYQGANEIGSFEEDRMTSLRVLGLGLGAEIGAAVLLELQGKPYVPIHDQNGNVCCIVDPETSTVFENYHYSPFGQESTQQQINNPWRFSSKRFDPETGFIYFGKRYYDSSSHQWITQDPLIQTTGPHLYTFVLNNPLTHIDLYGLSSSNPSNPPLNCRTETIYSEQMKSSNRFYLSPSQNRLIKGKCSHANVAVGYNNGINASLKDAISTAHYISITHGNIDVELSYSGTRGVLNDVSRHALQKVGVLSEDIQLTYDSLKNQFRQVGEKGCVIRYAHSAGVATLSQAAKKLEKQERSRLEIHALGGAVLVHNLGFARTMNYVSHQDRVTWTVVSKVDIERARREGTLMVLQPKNLKWLDHSILDETYREVIKMRGEDYKEQYGECA